MKVIIVGRDSNCDFVVDDVKVSRKHLQIIINDNGEYSVVDLGSMNGTFVNDNRIKGEIKLHRGDVIKIGNTDLPWKDIADGQDSDPLPKKPKKWIIYVFAALVVVLLSVIVGIIVNNHRNSKELEKKIDNLETLNKEAENNIKEANTKAKEAEKDKAKAEEAKGKAEKDKAKAEKARKEAEEGKKAADKKAETAEKEKQVADSNAVKAEKAKGKAEEDKAKAEKELKTLTLLYSSYNSLKTESEELQRKYYSNDFKHYVPCIYQEVLEQYWNTTIEKGKPFVNNTTDTLKPRIDQEFDKADLERKQKIIEIIKSVNKEAKDLQEYFDDHFTKLTEQECIEVYNKIKKSKTEFFTDALKRQIQAYFKYSSIKEKKKVNSAIKDVLQLRNN